MKETLARVVPGSSQPVTGPWPRPAFSLAVTFTLVACMAVVGCGPKIARVPVSDEDLIKSSRLAQEGNEEYQNREFYPALIKYLMAGELNPNSEYISNRIGMAYLQLEYREAAITAFQRSIALNSKFPFPFNNLGSAYFADGNYKKAEKYFKKAIKLKKDEASFYLNLGNLYFEKNKPEEGLEEWRKSLSLDPEILTKSDSIGVAISGGGIALKERNYFMARVYAAAGDIPRTIESLENALLNGFSDIESIEKNPEFDPIRKDARFVKFMESAFVWDKTNYSATNTE